MRTLHKLLAFSLLAAACSCKKQSAALPAANSAADAPITRAVMATTTTETFETGSKTAYAAADVVLGTGTWNLNDALLGNLSTDRKNGSQSARIRNSGKLTMKFNLSGGASTVTIKHAVFGTDGSSTWQLWYSTNSGSSWTQTGGTITTGSATLRTASFTVNVAGTIRFELRKTDGSSNRVNID